MRHRHLLRPGVGGGAVSAMTGRLRLLLRLILRRRPVGLLRVAAKRTAGLAALLADHMAGRLGAGTEEHAAQTL